MVVHRSDGRRSLGYTVLLYICITIVGMCGNQSQARSLVESRHGDTGRLNNAQNLDLIQREFYGDLKDKPSESIYMPRVFSKESSKLISGTGIDTKHAKSSVKGSTPDIYGLMAMMNVLIPSPGIQSTSDDNEERVSLIKPLHIAFHGFSKSKQHDAPDVISSNRKAHSILIANLKQKKIMIPRYDKVRRRTSGGPRMNMLRNISPEHLAELLQTMKTDAFENPEQQIGSPNISSMMNSVGRGDISINLDLDALTNMLASVRRRKYVGQMTETRNMLRNIG